MGVDRFLFLSGYYATMEGPLPAICFYKTDTQTKNSTQIDAVRENSGVIPVRQLRKSDWAEEKLIVPCGY